MEQFLSDALEELEIELEIEKESDKKILSIKFKNAVREVTNAFNFKPYHEEDFINFMLERHINNVKNLATYDYLKIGAEGESSHTENGISRVYTSRKQCFAGIVPFAD